MRFSPILSLHDVYNKIMKELAQGITMQWQCIVMADIQLTQLAVCAAPHFWTRPCIKKRFYLFIQCVYYKIYF